MDTTPDSIASKLLTAAVEQLATVGISQMSTAAVARRAGVDRGTIYRHIGPGAAVLDAAMAFEGQRVICRIQSLIEPIADPAERLEVAFAQTVLLMRNHPVLVRSMEVDHQACLAVIARISPKLLDAAADLVETELNRAHIGDESAEGVVIRRHLAELIARVVHSLVVYPDAAPILHTEAELRQFVRSLIQPVISVL